MCPKWNNFSLVICALNDNSGLICWMILWFLFSCLPTSSSGAFSSTRVQNVKALPIWLPSAKSNFCFHRESQEIPHGLKITTDNSVWPLSANKVAPQSYICSDHQAAAFLPIGINRSYSFKIWEIRIPPPPPLVINFSPIRSHLSRASFLFFYYQPDTQKLIQKSALFYRARFLG